MSNPITREEILLNSIANSQGSNLTPITREEQYLSYIAGETSTYPIQPITRKEQLLSKIAQNGIGGGSGVNIQTLIASENDTYTAPQGVAYSPVIVQVQSQNGGDEPSVNKLAQLADRSITEVTADDLAGATKIAEYAFYKCQRLVSIVIPDTVTSIGDYAFEHCTGLKTSIEIPDSVTSIEYMAFYNCSGLTSITIGDGVTKIGSSSFQYCTNVESVTIGNSVTNIGYNAFGNVTHLASVTIKAETPPVLDSTAFNKVPADCAIYVPAASVEAYKAATNWSARADYIFPIEE